MSSWVGLIASSANDENVKPEEDGRVFRLLEEELRNVSAELNQQREELNTVAGSYSNGELQVAQLKEKMAEYEGYVLEALGQNKEDLAKEVVGGLVGLEGELLRSNTERKKKKLEEGKLRASIRRLERSSQQLKQQADTYYASRSAQKAQLALVNTQKRASGSLRTAIDSYKAAQLTEKSNDASIECGSGNSGFENELLHKLTMAGIIQQTDRAEELYLKIKKMHLSK